MRLYTRLLMSFLAAICLGGCVSGTQSSIDPAELRALAIDAVNNPPSLKPGVFDDPWREALRPYAEQYYELCVRKSRSAGRIKLIVVDEAGQPVPDVNISISQVWNSGWSVADAFMDRGFRGKKEERVVTGEFDIRWLRKDAYVELRLRREGYRDVRIVLDGNYSKNRYAATAIAFAEAYLMPGRLLPPDVADGPLRIVLPPALIWPPDKEGRPSDDSVPGGWGVGQPWAERKGIPTRLPVDPSPLVSSAAPRATTIPKRGTYAFLDSTGHVLILSRFDAGEVIGVRISFGSDINRYRSVSTFCSGGGSSYTFDGVHNRKLVEPLQWQWYAEPMPAR